MYPLETIVTPNPDLLSYPTGVPELAFFSPRWARINRAEDRDLYWSPGPRPYAPAPEPRVKAAHRAYRASVYVPVHFVV